MERYQNEANYFKTNFCKQIFAINILSADIQHGRLKRKMQ